MVFFEPMNPPIAPSSPELTKFYRERYNWRNAGEERMRFRKHMQLAQVRPGSAVLDIGSRNGDLRKYLPRSPLREPMSRDRKSTRLNSSHGYISYAVFCLKKKKQGTPPAANDSVP